MRVLGIDPGLTRCGYGVVEGLPGRPPQLLAVGVIRTDSALDAPRRLVTIEVEIQALLETWLPDVLAVERVFAQNNLNTVMGTAQASGVAMLVGARNGIPVAEHTPSEVKAAISGSGRADKKQVGTMVARVLRLDEPPKPADAADAVALAICHVWRGGTRNRLTEATARHSRTAHGESMERAREIAARQTERIRAAQLKVQSTGGTR
ncbi:crossover junction endodeoxyribonuclease RuvC [Mariniluteicoccus endophyticus]